MGVRIGLHDGLLDPLESLPGTLSVYQRHIDVEKTEKTVCHVLRTGCLSLRGPGHPSGDAGCVEMRLAEEIPPVYAGNRSYAITQLPIGAEAIPPARVEHNFTRSKQLLKSPPPFEPRASAKGRVCRSTDVPIRDVFQVYVANIRLGVPAVHGVDCFGQLRTALLVNAAARAIIYRISWQVI